MCVVYQITLLDLQNVSGTCFDCGVMLTTKTKPDLNPLTYMYKAEGGGGGWIFFLDDKRDLTFSVAVRLSLARILRQVLVIVIYYGYEK